MDKLSISISKGNGNIKHNERTQLKAPKNVDTSRTPKNRTAFVRDIQKAYSEIFDESVTNYNKSQIEKGHAERQIKNYYKKVLHDKKTKPFHELVVQVGNKDDNIRNDDLMRQLYGDFIMSFKKNNPQFELIGAYLHLDESTPHMHIDYIPVANYAKGQSKRVSNDKAIRQMGYKSWNDWHEKQMQTLEKVLNKYHIERNVMDNHEKHIPNVELFKRKKQLETEITSLERSRSVLESDLENKRVITFEIENGLETLKKGFKNESEKINELKNTQKELVSEIQSLKSERMDIIESPIKALTDNSEAMELVNKTLTKVKNYSDRSVDTSEFDNIRLPKIKYVDDSMVQIKRTAFSNKQYVEMSIDTWEQIKTSQNAFKGFLETIQKSLYELKHDFIDKVKLNSRLRESVTSIERLIRRLLRMPNQIKISEYEQLKNNQSNYEYEISDMKQSYNQEISKLENQIRYQNDIISAYDYMAAYMDQSEFMDYETGEMINKLDDALHNSINPEYHHLILDRLPEPQSQQKTKSKSYDLER